MSSERLDEARGKLHKALQDMADELAPRECEHGDYSTCMEGCEWDDTRPVREAVLLTEFVLVSAWTAMESGELFVGVHTVPKQPLTHTNGLLHTALYEI